MPKLLLLYDTDDRDFARDVADFAVALGVEVEMIARAPDEGRTLEGKEEAFFDSVEAALFLITPGSERHGIAYPSPSVADEMGRAKEKFRSEPWRVIYVVDSEVTVQAVDQRAYIRFVRTDHRSMVDAMRRLVLAFKDARLLTSEPPPEPAPEVDIAELVEATPADLKRICHALAGEQSGMMLFTEFQGLALSVMGDQTDANLAVRDLQRMGLVTLAGSTSAWASFVLTTLGFDLVRFERAQQRGAATALQIAQFLASPMGRMTLEGKRKRDGA